MHDDCNEWIRLANSMLERISEKDRKIEELQGKLFKLMQENIDLKTELKELKK